MHDLDIAYEHNSCEWHCSCYIINFTEEAKSAVNILYVLLLSTMPPKPSYRRNRDYMKLDWPYDLKRDVLSKSERKSKDWVHRNRIWNYYNV